MKMMTTGLVSVLVAGSLVSVASAHDGRRLEIQVVNDQIVTQGYNSAGVDDGGGVVRPYYNAIHGHWSNLGGSAFATLPGFDVFAGSELAGFDVDIELVGAQKWVAPPAMPPAGTVVELEDMVAGEEIFVTYGDNDVSTTAMGRFNLLSDISASGELDVDLVYSVNDTPSAVLMVLEFVLSTNAAGIAASDSVYVILSPDGNGPMEKLHHASLYLESFLGTPVPAPGAMTALGLGGLVAARRRR
ncbi:MAG: PEP-CTERM sorting domain-containing protein [Planctomycetota bacterium]